MTRWAADVSPDNVAARISAAADGPPRLAQPQRPVGLRDPAAKRRRAPSTFDGQILVPFPDRIRPLRRDEESRRRQSPLVSPHVRESRAAWSEPAYLLHFGAVDWEATVCVNGKSVGTHRGGYDAFTFDITDALKPAGDAGTRRLGLGPDRRRHAAARQTGQQARRHLVHVRHRHLADRLARAGARRPRSTRLNIVPDIDAERRHVTSSTRGGDACRHRRVRRRARRIDARSRAATRRRPAADPLCHPERRSSGRPTRRSSTT